MILIRILVLNNLQHSRKIQEDYIDTKSNYLADALARNQLDRFRKLAPTSMDEHETRASDVIWPVEKIWYN